MTYHMVKSCIYIVSLSTKREILWLFNTEQVILTDV